MAVELGRYLVEQAAGTAALCLLNPSDTSREALRAGLEEGLGGSIPVVFADLDRQDDPRQAMQDSLEMSIPLVQANLNRHPDTDLLVCLADLPMDGRGLAAFLRKQNLRLAAGNVFAPTQLAPYARAGVFAGASVYRDNAADIDDLPSATSAEIFKSLYVLVPASMK